jgi:hypothetical protein
MTTDEEQDLLRAMLVMGAAGLDGMVKQLIRDALPALIDQDTGVHEGLVKFVERRVKAQQTHTLDGGASKFIARVLAAQSQQAQVIEDYICDLTGGSLQSAKELIHASLALGVDPERAGITEQDLAPIFKIRNMIIHELDMNLDAERRRRNLRAQDDMTGYVDRLLGVGKSLLEEVNQKVQEPSSAPPLVAL